MTDFGIQATSSQMTNNTIRWRGVFAVPEMESHYRQGQMKEDLSRVRLVVGVTVIGFLVNTPNDFYFSSESPDLKWLLAMRLFVLMFSAILLVKLHRGVSVAGFDHIVLAWSLLGFTALLYASSTRPVEYIGHTVLDVLFVLLTYLAVPLPVTLQALSAGLASSAIVVMGFWIKPWEDDPTILAMLTSLITANILGAGVSRELQVWRRRQYAALCQQQELSLSLEKALGEIKTLQGILPICMHCKRVRSDSGFWQQVEVYVAERSQAEFSHGLCPDCAQSMYPGVDWEKARARVLKDKPTELKRPN